MPGSTSLLAWLTTLWVTLPRVLGSGTSTAGLLLGVWTDSTLCFTGSISGLALLSCLVWLVVWATRWTLGASTAWLRSACSMAWVDLARYTLWRLLGLTPRCSVGVQGVVQSLVLCSSGGHSA